jgi:hypothetical protein
LGMIKKKCSVVDQSITPALATYTVRQASAAIHVHPETFRDFLRNQRVQGFRVGHRWRVSGEVMAALLKTGVPLK